MVGIVIAPAAASPSPTLPDSITAAANTPLLTIPKRHMMEASNGNEIRQTVLESAGRWCLNHPMSERLPQIFDARGKAIATNSPLRFAACDCLNCGGGIEFNATDFAKDETRTVECPHCHKETCLFVERERRATTLNLSTPELDPLTPRQLSDFVGQSRVKARLELAIAAARQRGEALDHILFTGSPGSGKATLANIVATAMGANIKATSGSAIEKASDLAGLLTNLEEGEVLFIDEIHRLQKTIAEYLQEATTFQLHIFIDQGPNARRVRLNLPRFTLISSAERKEQLSRNLLSCFPIIENMDDYGVDELAAIARRFAKSHNVEIDEDAACRIAQTTDGTPLDVLNRLRHIRDYAQVKGDGKVTLAVAEAALKMLASSDEKQEARESRDAIPSAVRREVWRRDEGKCVKCGSRKNLEYDHIIPVAEGGSNTARNIELLCEACNRAKSDLIQ